MMSFGNSAIVSHPYNTRLNLLNISFAGRSLVLPGADAHMTTWHGT